MKRRIFYGSIVVALILLLIYSVILMKRGMILESNSPLVTELYEITHPSGEVAILNELYQEDGFTNAYMLAVGAKNYLKEEQVENIPASKIEISIQEVFGKDVSFQHEDFYLFSNNICGYTYNKEKKSYEQILGCGGNASDTYETQILEANRLGKRITIKEAVLYISKEEETSIYTSSTKQDLIARVKNESFHKEDYLDQASIYEYVFELADKKYVLKEIKKIR